MALDHSAGSGRHRLAEHRADVYETPPEAVQALLRVERLPHRVWEPCCGPGSIVRVLRDAGHDVVAADLNDHGCPDSAARIDFLMERATPAGVDAVVTNPPYALAAEFVAHALGLVPRVVMLLRLAAPFSTKWTAI
jgi:methylase of polypeptide subunit release factors